MIAQCARDGCKGVLSLSKQRTSRERFGFVQAYDKAKAFAHKWLATFECKLNFEADWADQLARWPQKPTTSHYTWSHEIWSCNP